MAPSGQGLSQVWPLNEVDHTEQIHVPFARRVALLHPQVWKTYHRMRKWINWMAKSLTGYHRCRQRTMLMITLACLTQCVIPCHWWQNNVWLVPAISIIRKCVFPFHEQHNHRWHVSATFYSQLVRNPISWTSPWSRLTCSRHFRVTQSWLTCPCHFWLLDCEYSHFMRSTIMADMFMPLLTLSGCVTLIPWAAPW